jgi:hypothetical protein
MKFLIGETGAIMIYRQKHILIVCILLLLAVTAACGGGQTTTPVPVFSQYQLGYQLLAKYSDYFWCDPDLYPVARDEQANALEQFPTIQGNSSELAAILEHLNFPEKSDYTDSEKLSIYREHKLLSYAVSMTPAAGSSYNFSLRTGENQGLHIAGTIDSGGRIKIQTQETAFNTCPICLSKGTLIDTPSGEVPVEQLKPGMPVFTLEASGEMSTVTILKTSITEVPVDFRILKLILNDGRTITASPGHPTADMKPLGNYQVGDTLDGGQVVSIKYTQYNEQATFDILPGGNSGLYRANGIWLMSTLKPD